MDAPGGHSRGVCRYRDVAPQSARPENSPGRFPSRMRRRATSLRVMERSMREIRGARRWSLIGVLILVAIILRTPALAAQAVSGTVRDSASQQPLPNTRVVVVDPAGRATAQS